MDPSRMMLMAVSGGNNLETFTNIPQVPYSGSPVDFGTLFQTTHGRSARSNELATFVLPNGEYHGIATNTLQGVQICWRLGEGWSGNFPKQMKLIINGTQFAAGGMGMKPITPVSNGWQNPNRNDVDFLCDGGSVISLINTETFINSNTPLLLEGNGTLISGGGGSGCTWSGNIPYMGRDGAGYPRRGYIYSPPDWNIQTKLTTGMSSVTYTHSGTEVGGATSLHSGAGGGYGRYGQESSYTGESALSQIAWGYNAPYSGEPGVIFEWLNNSDARFQTQSGILACFDFTNFNGVINNQTAVTWKANFASMRAAALFGYKDPNPAFAYKYRKLLLNEHLRTYIGVGN